MDHQLEFRVLGPLEILADGRPVKVDAPKQRAILAVLLIHANEVVSTDQLLEAVWAQEQPSGGPRTLRYHIFKLREALPADVIRTRAPGYVLEVSPSRVDALVFESLLAEARDIRSTDRGGALKRLDEALGLWRGSAYADFTYEEFAHTEILGLQELQLRAMEDRFDICIELGREDEVIGELQRLAEEHPRRERLTGALMLALYRLGRQAEALSVYQNLRRELGEGLGIEPSQELQDLEERILLQDRSLTEASAPAATELLRGYVLRGRIGEGAHGVVWRAGQPGVGREVAIKAIRPDFSNRPGFVRRFEMEAQLVASLEHPHIVSLFDFWRDPEGAYLVMPYLRGGDLDHLLRQGPLLPDSALELIRAIGAALAYAHRRGVIHRDVTPHNVLLDDEGNPYLADFGVATLVGETGPPISSSPAYLSPEQHAGSGASPQSDVYSLGVLTHAVLTGQTPVEGEQLRSVLSYRSDVGASVDEIIEVATSIDVTERYASPEALVADLGRALGAPARVAVTPVIETRNPYKGLRAFAETDAGDFFGRDSLESELVEAVSRHRLVGVIGPSGCGKSSLVRAGLIPLLRRGVLPGSDQWLITDMYPGSQPFAELQAALLRVAVHLPARFAERLAGDAADRTALLNELLPCDAELLLIVDQFEELFTLTADEDERSRFLEALAEFAGDPLNRARIVVTLRADFYDRPLEYPEFAELLRTGLVTVAVPGREGLSKAVTGPAQRVGLEVEPGLAERITNDVAGQPGGLPLLEYALTELFQRRVESRLTLAGYEQTGGVLGALGLRAEDLYSGRDEAGQQAVQQVFLRLVTVEEGSADTRRRIPLAELRGMGLDAEALQQVLDDYGSHRLLTFDRDPDTRAPTVEVAHEALLTRWDRLRVWIDDRRDDLVLHRRLAASLTEWHDSGERPEYLLGGGRLEHFESFAAESDIALTTDESDFLAQSRAHADQLTAGRRRRRQAIMAGFGIAALIATVFAVVAFLNQQRAEDETARAEASQLAALEQKEAAEESRAAAEQERQRADDEAEAALRQATMNRAQELAAESRVALETDPELGILLALEAVATEVDGAPQKAALDSLHKAVNTSRLRLTVPGYWTGGMDASGDLLVAAGDYGPVTVYQVETGDEVVRLPVTGVAEQGEALDLVVALNSEGTQIATGRLDGTVALWDATSGRELFSSNDEQTLWTNAITGAFTLTFHDEGTAPISANVSAADMEAALEVLPGIIDVRVTGVGSESVPWRIEFLETETAYLARLTADSADLIPTNSRLEIAGRGHDQPDTPDFGYDGVSAVEFSPDGTTLASRGWDGTIRMWETDSWTQQIRIDAPLGPLHLRDLAFSPDGSLIAGVLGAKDNHYVGVWNAATGEPLRELRTGGGDPLDVAFLPPGNELAIARQAEQGTALTIWDVTTGEERAVPGQGAWLREIAVSPDGGVLAIGDSNGHIHIKEVSETGITDLFTFRGHLGWLVDLKLPNNETLISTGENQTRLWDLGPSGSSEWLTLPTTPWGIETVSYDPAGNLIAHTNVVGSAVITDAGTGENLHTLNPAMVPGSEWVNLVRFNPDGTQLAVSIVGMEIENGVLQLWDAASGSLVREAEIARGAAWTLEYSPDGSLLAGATDDEKVRLWDAATLEEILTIANDDSEWQPRGIAFSPDGTEFAVRLSAFEGKPPIQFYSLSGEELRRCCGHAQGFYLASVDYSPDGRYLITTGQDAETQEGTVKLWDLATGDEVATLQGHSDNALLAVFSPDGNLIASAGMSDLILWDAVSLQPMATLLDETAVAMGLSFSPDGKRLASVNDAPGEVRIWAVDTDELIELAQSRLTRTFTAAECEIYDIEPCPADD
jgi:WD40 repeat protein/DNA-binding SARP family transcriptional activator